MPAAQRQVYLSPSQAIVGTTKLKFAGFVPAFGPNGLRNVIDKLEAIVDLSAITVAGAVVEGEDVWRALSFVALRQVDGVERIQGIRGGDLRQYCYNVMGADRVPEYADIPVAAGTAVAWTFPIPLEQRYYRRPKDFSLPAELFREIELGGPDTGTDGLGVSSTVSAITGTMRVIAHCHEEDSVEQKMVDTVSIQDITALTGMTLRQPGRLHGLTLFARGAAGGTALTTSTFTSVQIPGLLPDALTRHLDLLPNYLAERSAALNDANAADGAAVHNDPAGQAKAVPVIWTNDDTSCFDGQVIDEVNLKTVMTQTGMLALVRSVLPESQQVKAFVERAHGIGRGTWRGKTISKGQNSRQNLAGSPWIPKSAPLGRRGLSR